MNDSPQSVLRHAVIGVAAGVLGMHRPGLELETTEVVAVADINAEIGRQRAEEFGCPFYVDYREMLADVRPDVTVILTPHPFHAPMSIDALRGGSHVLVEKPMAVHVAEADAMIKAAKEAERLLAVNFQQRFRPEIRAAHKLIQQGRLGEIQNVNITVAWPRTTAYYGLAYWRGTWKGEGGGVLMNQAPHNLDLICHLVGLPDRVVAWTRNLIHQTETEDTVHAMLHWPNGALGSLHISTAEAGIPERLDIVGTKGALHIHSGGLTMHELETDLREFVEVSNEPFGAPSQQPVTVTLEPGAGDHLAVYRDLHNAILHGRPLMADGTEGRMSLELANAMICSSYFGTEAELPLDRQSYVELFEQLRSKTKASSSQWAHWPE